MIESYSFGRITIDGKEYHSDVIVYPDRVDCTWWRRQGHLLSPEDLADVISARPETLIVGTGASEMMRVTPETRKFLEANGIILIAEATDRACTLYNEMARSSRVIAALHLTC